MTMTALALLPLFVMQGAPDLNKEPDTLREVRAFKKLPSNVRKAAIRQGETDEDGNVGVNRKQGWVAVRDQRVVAQSLSMAIAEEDHAAVDKTFRAVKRTFDRQLADGSFPVNIKERNGRPVPKATYVSSNLFWLKDAVPALMQLRAWDSKYKADVDSLREPIRRAAEFSYGGRQQLFNRDGRNANRMLMNARSFVQLGFFLKDQKYVSAGNEFLKEALSLQDRDGVFLEDGGGDTSYQSVSIKELAGIYYLEPRSDVKDALRRASDWYLMHFLEDGSIDTRGNTRTGIGKSNLDGGEKLGHHPVSVSRVLAIIADLFPDSKAQSISDQFTKRAYINDRQRNPRDYIKN
ncbi:MAG TPA: hypothetical protein VGE01_06435 [Fimbriimonas sp.]